MVCRERNRHPICRLAAWLIVIVMVLSVFPPLDLSAAVIEGDRWIVFNAKAGEEYYNLPIVINEQTMAQYAAYQYNGRYNIRITGSPYSVTVQGLTNVDITFSDVTIDRSKDTTNTTVAATTTTAFVNASTALGWGTQNGNNYNYIPTCPLLITGGADVVVSFDGTNNIFKAGGNGWYISTNNNRLVQTGTYKEGYAGIQVDGTSSLTIEGGTVEAWGAYQKMTTVQDAITSYAQAPSGSTPSGVSTQNGTGMYSAGGAGIGGGAVYSDLDGHRHTNHSYTQGTPGNITINGGTITAIGGFMAAGIGGGVNSAATTGRITINGDPATVAKNSTKVIAVGGYWSAGIGDGDSIQGSESSALINDYSIVINGGEVTAYGGTAAAGIGTTDEVSNYGNNKSGLSIALNGGDITAVSGYAQGGSGAGNATAAIGAGEDTEMEPYSITIAEGTIVKASSFSHYAISNIGTDAEAVPQTSVDPNTYMYLAYYASNSSLSSNSLRTFALHEIKRTETGEFMVVLATEEEVTAITADNASQYLYFGYEESTENFYLVDKDGYIVDPNGDASLIKYYLAADEATHTFSLQIRNPDYTGADGESEYLPYEGTTPSYITDLANLQGEDKHMSYYFIQPPRKTFEVPARYTAVAMTLYHPDVYGGRYILHVPKSQNMSSDIYATIEKMTSGESSGELVFNEDPHFHLGPPIGSGTPTVNPDEVSKELTNIRVTTGSDGSMEYHLDATVSAAQKFAPGTKSYDIWLPVGSTSFDVRVFWDEADITTVTYRIGTDTGGTVLTNGGTLTGGIAAGDEYVIWIEKTDTEGGKTLSTVVYMLTVKVKAQYHLIPKNPAKVYDGAEVGQGIDYMLANNTFSYTVVAGNPIYEKTAEAFEVTYPGKKDPVTWNGTGKVEYFEGNYFADAQSESISYTNTLTYDENAHVLTLVTQFTLAGQSISSQITWSLNESGVPTVVFSPTQSVKKTYTYTEWFTEREGTATFTTEQTNTGVRIVCEETDNALVACNFAFSTTSSGTNTKLQQAQNATAAAKNTLTNDSTLMSARSSLEYEVSETVTATLTFTDSNSTERASYVCSNQITESGTVTVTATRELEGDITHLLATETVTYTYQKLKNADGSDNVQDLSEAPVEAGTYKVIASVESAEYEADGELEFVISKRPITIIGIENWRHYLDDTPNDPENTPISIDDPGEITYLNIVEYADGSKDSVSLSNTPAPTFQFRDSVAGAMEPDKVQITAALPANGNYTFADYTGEGAGTDQGDGVTFYFEVPGQVAYRIDGAMFAWDERVPKHIWRKYYPVIDLTDPNADLNSYLKWDENGEPAADETRIDYHSPDNQSHAEYIYINTLREGEAEARYAVDITYGTMQFTYTKTIWDVNKLDYEEIGESGGSVWMAPSTTGESVHGVAMKSNQILIENRSNDAMAFTASIAMETHDIMTQYTPQGGNESEDAFLTRLNITPKLVARLIVKADADGDRELYSENELYRDFTGSYGTLTTERISLYSASAQDINGTPDRDQLPYSILTVDLFGIPQATRTVGQITITIYPHQG